MKIYFIYIYIYIFLSMYIIPDLITGFMKVIRPPFWLVSNSRPRVKNDCWCVHLGKPAVFPGWTPAKHQRLKAEKMATQTPPPQVWGRPFGRVGSGEVVGGVLWDLFFGLRGFKNKPRNMRRNVKEDRNEDSSTTLLKTHTSSHYIDRNLYTAYSVNMACTCPPLSPLTAQHCTFRFCL